MLNVNDLSASTFATCITDYLQFHCSSENNKIVIFSDDCTYQNRNVHLANALLDYSVNYHNISIEQKFLEWCHTQMECDSIHSAIERKLKGREINLPSDYLSVTLKTQRKPFPYEAQWVDNTFFKDFSGGKCQCYSSLRPGEKTNDPMVTSIRLIGYSPKGFIYVKLD